MPDFLNRLLGRSGQDAVFFPEDKHLDNRRRQAAMAPMTLEQLRELGVDPDRELRLEVFFYTNHPDKGAKLAQKLRDSGYEVESLATGERKGPSVLVNGWSPPILMQEDVLVRWTLEMCDIGFECDAEFDGWGTRP